MTYSIVRTDGSFLTMVADGTINTDALPITLYGKGYINYGEGLNDNLVGMLENFASPNAPNNAIRGQLWYDDVNNVLKVLSSNGGWLSLFGTNNANLSFSGDLILTDGNGDQSDLSGGGYLTLTRTDPNNGPQINFFTSIGGGLAGQIRLLANGTLQLYQNVTVTGNLLVDGGATIDDSLTVGMNGSFGGNLTVTGNEIVSGNLTLTNHLQIGSGECLGNFQVDGNEEVTGALNVTGNVVFGGTAIVTGTIQSIGLRVLTTADLNGYATASDLSSYATLADLNSYATLADLSSYATTSSLSNYATTSSLSNYATLSDLSSYATLADLSGYATTSSLSNYATTSSLSNYATLSDLNNYATLSDLSGYATTSSLSNYATTSSLSNYATTSSLSNYATTSDLNAYLLKSDYNPNSGGSTSPDLSNYATLADLNPYATTSSLSGYATTGDLSSYVQKSGDTMSGPLVFSGGNANALRLITGSYGTIFRNDGTTFSILTTNQNDQNGNYNSYLPFQINLATGNTSCANLTVTNELVVGANLTTNGTDGNVWSTLNLDPTTFVNRAGDTMTGSLNVEGFLQVTGSAHATVFAYVVGLGAGGLDYGNDNMLHICQCDGTGNPTTNYMSFDPTHGYLTLFNAAIGTTPDGNNMRLTDPNQSSAVYFRNDGANFYLLTNGAGAGPSAAYNSNMIPLYFNLTNGDVVSNTNLYVAGSITAGGPVAGNSDVRLKTDIATIDDALELVKKMRGVRYTLKKDGSHGVGVIAQEMEQVLAEVVHDNTVNGVTTKAVAYGNLTGVLIEAVKQLSARCDTLADQIAKMAAA